MIGDHDPGTPVISPGFATHEIVAGAPTILRYAKVLNNSGSDLYLMIFDAVALPVNGTAPSRIPIPIPAFGVDGDEWPPPGTRLRTGCVVALSSTIDTLTIVGSAVGWFDVGVWP